MRDFLRGTAMRSETVKSIQFEIFMAGDIAQAKQACREYCRVGLCVTIEPCDYIYTGGEMDAVYYDIADARIAAVEKKVGRSA